jgi:N-acetylneuraminic acid mutarotase
MPGKLAYHSSVVYKDSAFIFGGNNYEKQHSANPNQAAGDNSVLFQLDLPKMTWHAIKTKGDNVPSRDEHTAVLDAQHGQMIVFGGFCDGFRTNDVGIYNIGTNTWSKFSDRSSQQALPCPRSGHSAVFYSGHMFIFGGKDDDSEKLDDLWTFNIGS